MEATETTLASVSNPNLKRGNRVQGTLILRRVQHIEEANLRPRRPMEVRCSFLESIVLSMVVLKWRVQTGH